MTCIVGPNGCGKTNVADSLRWVLGEHASRTLRARKTEDVIFAGSDKRAPMGVAEVSIALDNSGQWLPIDYAEVVVTRRAYRNGDNEYFINNARVRLRDVVDLFMRAQVGQNSYAFMGQGMVEQVLSLRPEDRRALIEEAADVRLHRTKLEEAQRKLKGDAREYGPRAHARPRDRAAHHAARTAGRTRREVPGSGARARSGAARLVRAPVAGSEQQLLAAMAAYEQRNGRVRARRTRAKHDDDGLVQLRAAIDERRREIATRTDRLRNLEDYAHDLERRAALDAERGKLLAERVEELTANWRRCAKTKPRRRPSRRSSIRRSARPPSPKRGHRSRRHAHPSRKSSRNCSRAQRAVLTHEQTAAAERLAAEALGRRISERQDRIARLQRDAETQSEERRKILGDLAAMGAQLPARTHRRERPDSAH